MAPAAALLPCERGERGERDAEDGHTAGSSGDSRKYLGGEGVIQILEHIYLNAGNAIR